MAVTPTIYPELVGYGRTTDAVATDVPGLSWTPADKTAEVYEIEATAVRENTVDPLSYNSAIRVLVRFSAGAASIVETDLISELGDAAMAVALVLGAGGTVKVQVTGVAATTFNWFVRATRQTLLSN